MFVVLMVLLLRPSPSSTVEEVGKEKSQKKQDTQKRSIKDLLLSPHIWKLGLGYSFLTVVRVGVADWSVVMLREVHGAGPEMARNCLVALELGGFIGGRLGYTCVGISVLFIEETLMLCFELKHSG